jgi:hypothetical protein
VRSLRIAPLLAAIATCVLFALLLALIHELHGRAILGSSQDSERRAELDATLDDDSMDF